MDAATSEVANIGPRERRKRRLLGIVSLTVAVGVAFVLVTFDAPRWSRLVVFFPLWMAALGLLQAREKTCIALAARGVCNLDAGEQTIEDETLAARLREKASSVHKRSLLVAAVITVVVLLFPDFRP